MARFLLPPVLLKIYSESTAMFSNTEPLRGKRGNKKMLARFAWRKLKPRMTFFSIHANALGHVERFI